MQLLGMLALLLLVGGSIASAVWIGIRLKHPALASVAAWVLTPMLMLLGTIVLIPVFRTSTSPTNDGTWIIMIPIYGVVLGLLSAGIACVLAVVRRRRASAALAPPPGSPTAAQ